MKACGACRVGSVNWGCEVSCGGSSIFGLWLFPQKCFGASFMPHVFVNCDLYPVNRQNYMDFLFVIPSQYSWVDQSHMYYISVPVSCDFVSACYNMKLAL